MPQWSVSALNFNLVSFSHSLPPLHSLSPVCVHCVCVCVCMLFDGGDSCSLVLDDVTTLLSHTHIAGFQEISG